MPFPVQVDRYVIGWSEIAQNTPDADPDEAATKNGTATGNNDEPIPCAGARYISITVNAPAANNSTNFDINVIASNDGGTFYDDGTNHIYASKNFTGDQTGSFNITPGPTHIKLRADENDTGTLTANAYVTVTWE